MSHYNEVTFQVYIKLNDEIYLRISLRRIVLRGIPKHFVFPIIFDNLVAAGAIVMNFVDSMTMAPVPGTNVVSIAINVQIPKVDNSSLKSIRDSKRKVQRVTFTLLTLVVPLL